MRVAHVLYLSDGPGRNPIGGAETATLDLLEGLARTNHQVELFAVIWNDGDVVRRRLAALELAGVRVTSLVRARTVFGARSRLLRALEVWWRLLRAVRARRPPIVHVHLDLVAAPLLALIAGVPHIVATIHNDERDYRTPRWRMWLRLLNQIVERYIGITRHVSDYFREQAGAGSRQVSTVYYGIDPEWARRPPIVTRPFGSEVFVVGFIGRLVEQKNVDLLVEAVAGVPDTGLLLIGDGPERPRLEALIADRNVTNVRMLGARPNGREYLQVMDVLCLPSRWEGLGLVLLEAMSARVPIVATAAGAIPEVLGNGEYGILCTPGSVSALRDSLEFARQNRAQLKEMADRAHQHVERAFSIAAMVRDTSRIYHEIASGAATAAGSLDEAPTGLQTEWKA